MADKRPVYAIFSGGGVKAAAFVGAVQEAERHVQFKGVGGTSAGAIVAMLIACGYSGRDLENALFDAPYPQFFRRRWVQFFRDHRKGLFDPGALLTWLRARIAAKTGNGRLTFREWTGTRLKVIATNVSTQQIHIYSATENSSEEVAHAVLASCSFPVFFPPVRQGASEIVDGGLMTNFPMWLFDDERKEPSVEQARVIGFALQQRRASSEESVSFPSRLFALLEAMLIAQDRVQEKYLEVERLADVIRIIIPITPTFDIEQQGQKREVLIDAGRLAAKEYFEKTSEEKKPIPAPDDMKAQAQACLRAKQWGMALSHVARDHILHGGIAQDKGLGGDRRMVRYYVDLMGAVTDFEKLSMLADVLAQGIHDLAIPFDRVVGLKKGNLLLAAKVAERMGKPFAILKSDMSYKMGSPFDGTLKPKERVLLVDDVASDASMLVRAVAQIRIHRATIAHAVTLIDRAEGDARELLDEKGCTLMSICHASDDDIDKLLYRQMALPSAVGH